VNWAALDITILGPALLAGAIVLTTHVPLGREVLHRGIIFIDLAVAQAAGLGVIAASGLGWDVHGPAAQLAAFTAALGAAMILTWTEARFGEVQEALIGMLFVLAATGGILLLATNPRGGEELRELLVGQILWVDWHTLGPAAVVSTVVAAIWIRGHERFGRIGFYVLFALSVTVSVQLVGHFLGLCESDRARARDSKPETLCRSDRIRGRAGGLSARSDSFSSIRSAHWGRDRLGARRRRCPFLLADSRPLVAPGRLWA